ncbi:hypothetical protein YK48G_08600 [Lentilactobacillus fungorum]|uniref:Gram-positive cocci surface proteins LPxTG domain-containing protein n=1 Tax=Lentilactobacillus fungorum TaxID=2201250 RepID=A0ABQ3VX08_9LACO|nr:Cna B-type domain-containing protein [Lentilactobacillus fungorum]GHP13435.1 hypothetical protein YK48G_08600 [Lentilactobacillus fungorum]
MNIDCRLKRGACFVVVSILTLVALIFLSGPIRVSADVSGTAEAVPVSVQTDTGGTTTATNVTQSTTDITSSPDPSVVDAGQTDSVNSTQAPEGTGADVNTDNVADPTSSSVDDQTSSNQDTVNSTHTQDSSVNPDQPTSTEKNQPQVTAKSASDNLKDRNMVVSTPSSARLTAQAEDSKQDVQATAAVQAADSMTVTTEQQLADAISKAPKDGTAQTIILGGSFATKQIEIVQGQNITFTNDAGQKVTLKLNGAIIVDKGATLNFHGDQAQGITIAPGDDFQRKSDVPLQISGTTEMTGTDIMGFSFKPWMPHNVATVTVNGANASLTMDKDARVINNNISTDQGSNIDDAGGISVNDGATLTMNEGSSVTGNTISWNASLAAGGIGVHDGSHLILNGGTVSNNQGPQAGGIIVGDRNDADTDPQNKLSTFVMNSGKIDGNISWNEAGGVYINGNGSFVMNGGAITNNSTGYVGLSTNAAAPGGGIAVSTGYTEQDYQDANVYDQNNAAKLVINDGLIDGNKAAGPGGGIYVNSNAVTIKKAKITNNSAAMYGGGIYVSIAHYTLKLGNSLITNNSATAGSVISWTDGTLLNPGIGGGVWFCPTGNATINVTDGTAIYGNSAVNKGNDFASEVKAGYGSVTLANEILGGGDVAWYHDRDGQQETTPVTITNQTGAFDLKSVSSAQALAAALATVIISGNSAPRGGGIGSNGTVIFGEPGTKVIKVNKQWDLNGNPDAELPGKVTINLTHDVTNADGTTSTIVVRSIDLTKDNHWTGEFADLPTNVDYDVAEVPVAGFNSTVSQALTKVSDGVYQITFINTIKPTTPTTPDTPVTPNTPTEPNTPDTPNEPDTPTTPNTPVVPGQPSVPGKPQVPNKSRQPSQPSKPSQPDQPTVPSKPNRPVNSTIKAGKTVTLAATPKKNSTAPEKLPQTGDQNSSLVSLMGLMILLIALSGMLVFKKRRDD